MAINQPLEVNTVIIGGGPSSLILSYILHGHIPYYIGGHRDGLLDAKIRNLPDLLHVTLETCSHFSSDIRYSSHALPINTLLDTLIRPDADTQINPESCVEWRHEPHRAVSHLILGSAKRPGGQWAQNIGSAVDDIGTLSYAEMLSLPGYTFADHYLRIHGKPLPELDRPSRTEVAAYYAAYPVAVGISDSIRMGGTVKSVSRHPEGFLTQPGNVISKNLVLGTGIFDHAILPPPSLLSLTTCNQPDLPLLVYGSGYSAADAIISCPPNRKIIHIYRWNPSNKPSPLKGCHRQAYPEYAEVYRLMKLAALKSNPGTATAPLLRRRSSAFISVRDWETTYEGFPNAAIVHIRDDENQTVIMIRTEDGRSEERTVGGLEYLVGRRGYLDYLSGDLRYKVLSQREGAMNNESISNSTLRGKAEIDTEVAPSVFIIGSLTGDSLVRHAFGSCVQAASRILEVMESPGNLHSTNGAYWNTTKLQTRCCSKSHVPQRKPAFQNDFIARAVMQAEPEVIDVNVLEHDVRIE